MAYHRIAAELGEALGVRRDENVALWRRYLNPGWAELLGAVGFGRRFVRARGLELEDAEGRRYLDFLSGYGALGLGHHHAAVRDALRVVLDAEVPHYTQVECSLPAGLAAERLAAWMPPGLDKVFFCSSGSEAVEAAIKLARAATGRKRIVACHGAYHGLSMGALALTGNPELGDRFRPLMGGVDHVPFGDARALREALRWGDAAAFVVEPIQGEGGAVVPPAGYLETARELTAERGVLLIVDEVQSGLGRTGRRFAFEAARVVPDAVTLAKTLGGGLMPVGALVARDEVFRRAYGSPRRCMDHATTFGGGPLAAAAVLATLRVLEDERLVENAAEQGSYLRDRLEEVRRRRGMIREVRGEGLMLGLRFEDAARGWLAGTPLASLGRASAFLLVQYVALRLVEEHRIVTQGAVNDPAVLKVMPPLTVDRAAVDRFVAALDAVLGDGGHAVALGRIGLELACHASWFDG